jgi:hypothetical protein
MAAQASIIINDGQGTPAAHTFAPKGARAQADKKDVALWRDQSPANAAGFLSITETHTPVNSNGMEKFRYVLDVPTLESPGSGGSFVPPPTRAYGTIAVIEVWAHQRASDQELKNIAAYVKNFTALQYFSDAIIKREAAW